MVTIHYLSEYYVLLGWTVLFTLLWTDFQNRQIQIIDYYFTKVIVNYVTTELEVRSVAIYDQLGFIDIWEVELVISLVNLTKNDR